MRGCGLPAQSLALRAVVDFLGCGGGVVNWEFETHVDMLVIVPTIILTSGTCEDPDCLATHWRVGFSWLAWTLEISW